MSCAILNRFSFFSSVIHPPRPFHHHSVFNPIDDISSQFSQQLQIRSVCFFGSLTYILFSHFHNFPIPHHASPVLRKTLNVDFFASKITFCLANINKFTAREQCPIYFPIVFGSFKPSQTMTFLILGCFNLKLLRIACSLFIGILAHDFEC